MSRQHNPETCTEGHPRTPQNTHVDKHGYVRCLTCSHRRYRNQHLPSARPDITPELKNQALQLRSQGHTYRAIGDMLGCSHSAAHKWASEGDTQ